MSAPVHQRRTRSGLPFGYELSELSLAAAVAPSTHFSLQDTPPPHSLTPDAHEPGQELVDVDEYTALVRSALLDDELTDYTSSEAASDVETTNSPSPALPFTKELAPIASARRRSAKNNNTRKSNVRRAAARAQLAGQMPARKAVHARHRQRGQLHAIPTVSDARRLPHSGPAWIGDRNASAPALPRRVSGSRPVQSGLLPQQRRLAFDPQPIPFPSNPHGSSQTRLRPLDATNRTPSSRTTPFSTTTPPSDESSPATPCPHGYGMAGPPLPQAAVDKMVGRKGFKHVNWSGDVALPMLDANRRVVGVLGGTPTDVESWKRQIAATVEPKHRSPQSPAAFPMEAGSSNPGIAGFTRGVYQTWAPKLYGYYYADTRDRLFKWKPSLRHGWPFEEDDGVFAAATFNFGRAVSCRHLDYGNLAWGWCAITALGEFDPDLGGHLILWELGLVIRFPPGSSILIPSAAIHHSNTAIQSHEHRSSFIQYSAGGLFRWVDNGCRPNEVFENEACAEQKAAAAARAATRWIDGLDMLEVV
uniref:Uncharacterized protein n=1 Tax=Mycena chlorophos TaxID=658473 RepID=A0ABQ0LG36_MYCCL|nr:predicted protein [Mycena chlorophos]